MGRHRGRDFWKLWALYDKATELVHEMYPLLVRLELVVWRFSRAVLQGDSTARDHTGPLGCLVRAAEAHDGTPPDWMAYGPPHACGGFHPRGGSPW